MDPLDELLAREAIRDLVARYNAGGDSGRFDEVVELFAPDAVLELERETLHGREEIAQLFRRTQQRVVASAQPGGRQHIRHFTATLQIDVEEPDAARGRCYFQVLMAHGLDHWGRYIDRYARVEGRWFFSHRRVIVDGRSEGSAALR
jgi:hypothetical protein